MGENKHFSFVPRLRTQYIYYIELAGKCVGLIEQSDQVSRLDLPKLQTQC